MIEHLLIPLDGSSLAECALAHGVAIARALDARVTLLRVLERSTGADPSTDPLSWHIRKVEATAYLNDVASRLQQVGLKAEVVLLEGQATKQIIEFSHSQQVNLIVLSSHGRSGLSGWNISSVVQKIILWACVPTMIVRAYQPITSELGELHYQRVMLPLDGSQRAECVLSLATKLTRFHKSKLLLAHVVSRPEMPRRAPPTPEDAKLLDQFTQRNRAEAARYLEEIRSRLTSDSEIHLLVDDSPAMALQELAEGEAVDLIALSAHGYSGGTKWPYGSVALNLIAYGTTPLLIVQDLSAEDIERTRAEVATAQYKGH
ncbi:MAG: universal stress protein [Anaerolineae bacterium]|nr:universal stress protein [Anaerolineae bacterium]